MQKNYIKKAYIENCELLKQLNPSACQFLKKLEQHAPSLWLSTDKNVHIYAGHKFLAYIKFFPNHTGIILSSQYNKKIWSGTEDHSSLLFQKYLPAIIEQHNDSQDWMVWREKNNYKVEISISKNVPETFFHQLYKTIISIAQNKETFQENNFFKTLLLTNAVIDGSQKIFIDLEKQIQQSQKLSKSERLKRLQNAPEKPESYQTNQTVFRRNPDVIAEVLERAGGLCEACGNPAPFIRTSNNTPYLEVHHKKQLAQGGDDTIENAIALCPNCHRKAHFGINADFY